MPIRSCIHPIDELLSNCGPPHKKTCILPTQPPIKHLRHIRELGEVKRSKLIPETTSTTPLTLISPLRSENSKRNKKVVTVKFSLIERAILPNGQVMESVISFNAPNEYWKPGALDDEPWYIMNCRITR